MGHAYYLLKRREEAVEVLTQVERLNPNFIAAPAYLAVLHAEMGRDRDARVAWERARRLTGGASLETIRQRIPYQQPADVERLLAAARKAGLH
jgi:tetratricopeptide (TPR) repeat protein